MLAVGFAIALGASVAVVGDVTWAVTWYHMDGPGSFDLDRELAQTEYSLEFSQNWKDGTVGSGGKFFAVIPAAKRDDEIGFQARAELFVVEPGLYTIGIAANNGVRLWIDNEPKPVIDSWETLHFDGGGLRTVVEQIFLEGGVHTMRLWYYEWDGTASVSFETNIPALDLRGLAALYREDLADFGSQLASLTLVNAELVARVQELQRKLAEQQDLNSELDETILELEEALRTQSTEIVEE